MKAETKPTNAPFLLDLEAHEIAVPASLSLTDFQSQLRERLPDRRRAIFDVLLSDVMSGPPVSFLEIGVFQASNIKHVKEKKLAVSEFTGVDDFGGSGESPYIGEGRYWKDRAAADEAYEKAKAIYEGYGEKLHRETSDEYFARMDPNRRYDIIFVDGNHRYRFALKDMTDYFERVRDGGILLVDDYDNPDTPEVTRAAVEFIDRTLDRIERIRFVRLPFVNTRKVVPTTLTVLAIFKRRTAA